MSETLQFKVTAQLVRSILGSELYSSPGHCLWEIVRNGVCASMPDSKQWVAGAGDVEVILENHPLSPGAKALIVLDHGRGFNEVGVKRFCTLGASLADTLLFPQGEYGGASQKRIGRFAGLALNRLCYQKKDPSTGFFVITRNKPKGEVCLMTVVPDQIEANQGITRRVLPANSPELGSLAGIKGSFTAVVIANSLFTSYQEIREGLMWRVPRRKDQMFRLTIGGKLLTPPELASDYCNVSPDGTIEMFVGKSNKNDGLEPGIWFSDFETGLRVACAINMSGAHVPYPFYSPELNGDIFVPGILGMQDSARNGLLRTYLRSDNWLRVTRYLVTQAEPARGLLGETEPKSSSPVRSHTLDMVKICNSKFGPPELTNIHGPGGEPWETETEKKKRERRDPPEKDEEEKTQRESSGKPRKRPDGDTTTVRTRPYIRIGDVTYLIIHNQGDPRLLIRVDSGVIYINEGYGHMPSRREAREEHLWQAVLVAVAQSQIPAASLEEVLIKVANWRSVLFK